MYWILEEVSVRSLVGFMTMVGCVEVGVGENVINEESRGVGLMSVI